MTSAIDTPAVSAVICTWNRTELLRSALESFLRQTLPVNDWELIVVCNNSPEDTRRAVIEAQSACGYRLILIDEPRQGKCSALNAALAAARAPVIACTDDDCRPALDWLERIVAGFAAPEVGLLGGPGISVFRPDVAADSRRLFLGQRFLGDYRPYEEFVEIVRDNPPLGLNLSFRAEVARVIGGFSTYLGPAGGQQQLCREDTDFIRRAQAAGFRVFYDPDVVVSHHVESERVRWEAIRRMAFDGGESVYRERYQKSAGRPGRRLTLALRFALEYCYALARLIVFAPSYRRRMVARFRLTSAAGKLSALRRLRGQIPGVGSE
jgi:glycosyltransferase involved in cell wall biosynthesis